MRPTVVLLGVLSLLSAARVPAVMAQTPLPRRGALGVGLSPLTDSARAALQVPTTETGAVITSVTPGSTASLLRLQPGDVVVAVNNQPTPTTSDVVQALAGSRAGSPIALTRVRAGQRAVVRGVLQPRALERTDAWETVALEVTVEGTRQRVLATRPTAPGRHPVLMLIGGIGAYSLDGPLAAIPYGPILRAFADEGWATVRVDKPGQGDSDGGSIGTLRFDRELAGYQAAMALLATQPWADTSRVVLFGHSMGGSFAPLLANAFPMIKGVAVSAAIGVTFTEYWLINLRRQFELSGMAASTLDTLMRDAVRITPMVFDEGVAPSAVSAREPRLARSVRELFADDQTLSGMGLDFFRDLQRRNIGEAWSRVSVPVLALAGEADFVATREDHPRIARLVNAAHPGLATYRLVERTDHGLQVRASEADAFAQQGAPGVFSTRFLEVLREWARAWKPGAAPSR